LPCLSSRSVDKATLLKLTQLKIKAYIVRPYQPQRLFNDVLKAMGLEVVKETKWVRRVKKETQQSKTPDSD
jgi:DNA-binding NarL/FixJ family response regulator